MDSNPLVASAVTKLTITKTISVGSYRSIPFVRLEGIAHGELCSTEHIPDLAKAPRNARGKVEYQTRFVLIAPTEPKLSEGRLLVDVPNRGLPVSHAFYNSPRQRPLPIGSLDAGLGFLQEQGFMLVSTQWELGQGFEPPQFVDASGETHYVEAAGFAAVRDVARFLRDSSQADNPLAGVVKRIYAAGYSQTSRFLKSFLLNGFNAVSYTHLTLPTILRV